MTTLAPARRDASNDAPPRPIPVDLATEVAFLSLLPTRDRQAWLEEWFTPRVIQPLVRQTLARRALILELEQVLAKVEQGIWRTLTAREPSLPQAAASDFRRVLNRSIERAKAQDRASLQADHAPSMTPRLYVACQVLRVPPREALRALVEINEGPHRARLMWKRRFDAWEPVSV